MTPLPDALASRLPAIVRRAAVRVAPALVVIDDLIVGPPPSAKPPPSVTAPAVVLALLGEVKS